GMVCVRLDDRRLRRLADRAHRQCSLPGWVEPDSAFLYVHALSRRAGCSETGSERTSQVLLLRFAWRDARRRVDCFCGAASILLRSRSLGDDRACGFRIDGCSLEAAVVFLSECPYSLHSSI